MAMENDLHKLNGIGKKITAILESLGVDSIKELKQRKAGNLYQTILTKNGRINGVNEAVIQGWIDQAKAAYK